MSGGRFDLPEGTVYPALRRLERDGLLRSRWTARTGRRRRVYQLTDGGQRALQEQAREWHEFSRKVDVVLEGAS